MNDEPPAMAGDILLGVAVFAWLALAVAIIYGTARLVIWITG